jgi:hypothetical protein
MRINYVIQKNKVKFQNAFLCVNIYMGNHVSRLQYAWWKQQQQLTIIRLGDLYTYNNYNTTYVYSLSHTTHSRARCCTYLLCSTYRGDEAKEKRVAVFYYAWEDLD